MDGALGIERVERWANTPSTTRRKKLLLGLDTKSRFCEIRLSGTAPHSRNLLHLFSETIPRKHPIVSNGWVKSVGCVWVDSDGRVVSVRESGLFPTVGLFLWSSLQRCESPWPIVSRHSVVGSCSQISRGFGHWGDRTIPARVLNLCDSCVLALRRSLLRNLSIKGEKWSG